MKKTSKLLHTLVLYCCLSTVVSWPFGDVLSKADDVLGGASEALGWIPGVGDVLEGASSIASLGRMIASITYPPPPTITSISTRDASGSFTVDIGGGSRCREFGSRFDAWAVYVSVDGNLGKVGEQIVGSCDGDNNERATQLRCQLQGIRKSSIQWVMVHEECYNEYKNSIRGAWNLVSLMPSDIKFSNLTTFWSRATNTITISWERTGLKCTDMVVEAYQSYPAPTRKPVSLKRYEFPAQSPNGVPFTLNCQVDASGASATCANVPLNYGKSIFAGISMVCNGGNIDFKVGADYLIQTTMGPSAPTVNSVKMDQSRISLTGVKGSESCTVVGSKTGGYKAQMRADGSNTWTDVGINWDYEPTTFQIKAYPNIGGGKFWFRVAEICQLMGLQSDYSTPKSIEIPMPSPPTLESFKYEGYLIRFNLVAPQTTCESIGTRLWRYQYEMHNGDGNWEKLSCYPSSASWRDEPKPSMYCFGTFIKNRQYSIRARTECYIDGLLSDYSVTPFNTTASAAPTILRVSLAESGKIRVNYTIDSVNTCESFGSALHSYIVQIKGLNDVDYKVASTIYAGDTTFNASLTEQTVAFSPSIAISSSYNITMETRCQNSLYSSDPSSIQIDVPILDPPGAPRVEFGQGGVRVYLQPSNKRTQRTCEDEGSATANIQGDYSLDNVTWASSTCFPVDGTSSTCQVSNWPINTNLYFRASIVCAQRLLGSLPSEPGSGLSYQQAEAPKQVSVSGITGSGMTVSWSTDGIMDCATANSGMTTAGFEVWFSPKDGTTAMFAGTCAATSPTSATCTGLRRATTYSVQVKQLCSFPLASSELSTQVVEATTTDPLGEGQVLQITPTVAYMTFSGKAQDFGVGYWGAYYFTDVIPANVQYLSAFFKQLTYNDFKNMEAFLTLDDLTQRPDISLVSTRTASVTWVLNRNILVQETPDLSNLFNQLVGMNGGKPYINFGIVIRCLACGTNSYIPGGSNSVDQLIKMRYSHNECNSGYQPVCGTLQCTDRNVDSFSAGCMNCTNSGCVPTTKYETWMTARNLFVDTNYRVCKYENRWGAANNFWIMDFVSIPKGATIETATLTQLGGARDTYGTNNYQVMGYPVSSYDSSCNSASSTRIGYSSFTLGTVSLSSKTEVMTMDIKGPLQLIVSQNDYALGNSAAIYHYKSGGSWWEASPATGYPAYIHATWKFDECAVNNGDCLDGLTCNDTDQSGPGGVVCTLNECNIDGICPPNYACVDPDESVQAGVKCTLDECKYSSPCTLPNRCVDTDMSVDGGVVCSYDECSIGKACYSPFAACLDTDLTTLNTKRCTLDECTISGACLAFEECKDSDIYNLGGIICTVNECTLPDACPMNATCTDNDTTTLNTVECLLDECIFPESCYTGAVCKDSDLTAIGGVSCELDECSLNNGGCPKQFVCNDTNFEISGGVECSLDECLLMNGGCLGLCNDTLPAVIGGVQCYFNECLSNNGGCKEFCRDDNFWETDSVTCSFDECTNGTTCNAGQCIDSDLWNIGGTSCSEEDFDECSQGEGGCVEGCLDTNLKVRGTVQCGTNECAFVKCPNGTVFCVETDPFTNGTYICLNRTDIAKMQSIADKNTTQCYLNEETGCSAGDRIRLSTKRYDRNATHFQSLDYIEPGSPTLPAPYNSESALYFQVSAFKALRKLESYVFDQNDTILTVNVSITGMRLPITLLYLDTSISQWVFANETCGIPPMESNDTIVFSVCHLTNFAVAENAPPSDDEQASSDHSRRLSLGLGLGLGLGLPFMALFVGLAVLFLKRKQANNSSDDSS